MSNISLVSIEIPITIESKADLSARGQCHPTSDRAVAMLAVAKPQLILPGGSISVSCVAVDKSAPESFTLRYIYGRVT